MRLTRIINFNGAIAALKDFPNDGIDPFKVSRESIQTYEHLQVKLNEYLQDPDESEIEELFRNFGINEVVKQRNISKEMALKVLLRLHNFQLFNKIEFNTTEDLIEIINNFKSSLKLLFYKIGYHSNHVLESYFYFTSSLCLQPPVVNPINPKDKPLKPPVENILKSSEYESDSEDDQTKALTKTEMNKEIRINELTKIIALFFPKNEIKEFSLGETFHFKIKKSQLLSISDTCFPQIFDLSDDSEKQVEMSVWLNLLNIPVKIFSSVFEKTLINQSKAVRKSIDTVPVSVTPDLQISAGAFNIPVEVKKGSVSSYIDNFFSAKSIVNAFAYPFVQIFSQCIREALVTESPYAILTDHSSFYLIDLSEYNIDKEFHGDNFCRLFRGIECSIQSIKDSDNQSHSFYTILFMLLIKLRATQSQNHLIMKKFEDEAIISQPTRSTLIVLFYNGVNNFNDRFVKSLSLQDTGVSDTDADTSALTDVSELSTNISNYSSDLKEDHSFDMKYIYKFHQLYKTPKWKSYTMSEFQNCYTFQSSVSGAEFSTRYSCTFVVKDSKGSKYFLKVLDPIRSAIFVERGNVVEGAYNSSFKHFHREVSSYINLSSIKSGICKIFSYGMLNNREITTYQEVLDVENGKIPVCGFYILLEYLDGAVTLDMFRGNKVNVGMKARATLQEMHELGIYHRDIHPHNILVLNDTPYFVDFGRSKNGEKRLKWDGRKRRADVNIARRYVEDDDQKIDNIDLQRCLVEFDYWFPKMNLRQSSLMDKMYDMPSNKKMKMSETSM